MTKAELVGKIANESGITKAQAEKAVDGFVSAVSTALADGDKITLSWFRHLQRRIQVSARRPQPPDRRKDQNSCFKSCQVQSRQNPQRKSQVDIRVRSFHMKFGRDCQYDESTGVPFLV